MADGSITIDTRISTKEFEKGINRIENIGKKGLGVITVAAGAAVSGLTILSGYAIKVGSSFEAGMSKVQAISGATKEELGLLTEKAKEMGAKTKFSATESAEAFQYMAMAGWKTEDMLNGIEGIMNLAAASGEELAGVSDIVTDALTAFGLQAKDSGHFADVLAKASSNSNTNVGLMGETFKYVAPLAGSMRYSIEDTAVAIGLMANAGIKGSQAGTALRSTLTRLVKPPKDAEIALKKLGISAKNSNGTMKPLSQTMGELRKKFSKLNESQKASYAASIAGQEAMSGLLAIVNASDSDYQKLVDSINHADGAAQSMADTMNDNLAGATTIMKSTIESLGIALYDKFSKPTTKGIKDVTKVFGNLKDEITNGRLSRSIDKIADGFGKLIKKSGELVSKTLPKLIDGLCWIMEHGNGIAKIIGSIAGVMIYLKAAAKTADMVRGWQTATKVIGNFSTVIRGISKDAVSANGQLGTLGKALGMIATPAGLATTAIIGLTTAAVIFAKKQSDEVFGLDGVRNSIDKQKESWQKLKEAREEQLNNSANEISSLQNLKDELSKITDENGKVKDGYKDRANYIVGELSKALGTEIKLNGDIVEKYQEVQSEVQKLIEKKKAEALLNAYANEYAEAMKKQAEATENLVDLKKQLKEKTSELVKATGKERAELELSISAISHQIGEEANQISQYGYTIQNYENLQTASVNGSEEAIRQATEKMGVSWNTAKEQANGSLQEQIVAQQEYVDALESSLNDARTANDEYQAYVIQKQLDSAKERLTNLKKELDDTSTTIDTNTAIETATQNLGNRSTTLYEGEIKHLKPITDNELGNVTNGINANKSVQNASGMMANRATSHFADNNKMAKEMQQEVDDIANVENSDTSVGSGASRLATEVNTNFNNNVHGNKWGSDLVDNIVSGLSGSSALGKIAGAAAKVAGTIASYIHHTVPDKGPLSDELEYMPDMIENLKRTLLKSSPKLENATLELAERMAINLDLKDVYKKMKASVDFETQKISAKVSATTDLKTSKGNSQTITNNNDNGIQVNQHFYGKEQSPHENAKETRNALRRIAYAK